MRTVNGLRVKLNHKHMQAHTDVLLLLPEGQKFVKTIDLGRIVGKSGCVETTPTDDIFYIRRPGRTHTSRCVRGKEGTPTTLVTIVFVRTPARIKLITAWIGGAAMREPHDPTINAIERHQAIEFWSNHALVI